MLAPTSTFTRDGLYVEQFVPTTPPLGVVVVTHGYAEHCGRYRELDEVIVAAGWAVVAYDVRGHGKSAGTRGYIERFDEYLTDLDAMLASARTLVPPGAPLVLLGHSHGSLITLRRLCAGTPAGVVAAIVASPFLRLRLAVPAYRKVLAAIASRVAPKLAQPNALRVEDLTSDRGKQQERIADTLCLGIATARWFTEAARAQQEVAATASKITVPVTWLVGGDDPIADPAQSRAVADMIAGTDYHDLKGLKHEVFNETTRAHVFDLVTAALATARSATASRA